MQYTQEPKKCKWVQLTDAVATPGGPSGVPASHNRSVELDKNGVPLGLNYQIFNPPPDAAPEEKGSFNRVLRYTRQAMARKLLPEHRVGICLRQIAFGKNHVKLLYNSANSRAHYGNLCVCGSIWVCPICAAKVTERRRQELRQALLDTPDDYTLLFCTFTVKHKEDYCLKPLLKALSKGYSRLKTGAPWKRWVDRLGLIGTITGQEVTVGVNGWHPHKHALFVCTKSKKEVEDQLRAFKDWLKNRWMDKLEKQGYECSYERGVTVEIQTTQEIFDQDKAGDLLDYSTKWGLDAELTKAPVKKARDGGLTPFQLLDLAYLPGVSEFAETAWVEYATAFAGLRQLVWSDGLRARLGLDVEKTDEEIANEKVENSDVLALITPDNWKKIIGNDIRGEVLEIASTGSLARLEGYLKRFGVTLLVGGENE